MENVIAGDGEDKITRETKIIKMKKKKREK